jgi:hypothetical protein
MNIDNRLKSEKERIYKITVATHHRIERDKWLLTKRILDWISKQLSVLEDGPQTLWLSPNDLPPEQKGLLAPTLKNLFHSGIATFGGTISNVVITSEPARKFSEGEDVVIKDRKAFEEYHQKVSEFYNFIEEDGKERFPESYHQTKPTPLTNEPSLADKKKLYILEKLRLEWDFVPKQNSEPMIIQAFPTYGRRAFEISIPEHQYSSWIREYALEYHQFNSILAFFQQEGLLDSFNFMDESR